MKKIYLFFILIAAFVFEINAQTNQKIGFGYFGNTLTYPGAVVEYELEKMFSEKASLPLRADVGFYYHKRYNTGLFADINFGFRRYFDSGFFLEESVGFGIISTFVSSDNVYTVDDEGNLAEASRYATTDLMSSITLGAGYNISKDKDKKKLIWVRPKIFWQFPHKTTSFYNVAVQVGYAHAF